MGRTTTRRTALRAGLRIGLLGGLAGALAACGVRWDEVRLDDVATPGPPSLSPDDTVRFDAVVQVQALADLAALSTSPAAVAARAAHRAHLAELGPLPGPVPSPSPTPSGWPSTSPPPTDGADDGADDADDAALGAGELATSDRLLAGAGAAGVDGGLARLVVAVATSCRCLAAGLGTAVPPATALPPPDAVDPAGLRAAGDAVTALVEAHRAAAYGYGVAAVRLTSTRREAARAGIDAHRAAAAALVDLAARAGTDVGPARPAYVLARPADAAAAAALALGLELDVAAAAAELVGAADGDWRSLAADQVVGAALSARGWGTVPAFPGLAALS